MQKFTCLAIDDDALFLRCLQAYTEDIEWITIKETFTNPVNGATAILSNRPDVVFLDVEMPHVDGAYLIDWIMPSLLTMEKAPAIILVSSLSHPPQELLRKAKGFINKSEVTDKSKLERHLSQILLGKAIGSDS